MKDMTLYQIEEEGRKLLSILDTDGEIGPDAETRLLEWETQLDKKAEGYCQIIAHFEAFGIARGLEESRLRGLRLADEARAKYLRDRLKAAMERLGLTRIETPLFKISINKNGGLPSVRWDGPAEEIPVQLRKDMPPELDKGKALIVAAAGEAPAALIVERGNHLRIR